MKLISSQTNIGNAKYVDTLKSWKGQTMVQSSLFISELDNRFQLTDSMISQAATIAGYKDESEFLLYLDSLGITKRTNIFKTGGAEKFNSMFPTVLDFATL